MATEGVLDKVVERVEIAVRPELRGEVADGETARAARGEKVVAREPNHFVIPLENAVVATGDDFGAAAYQRHSGL